MRSKLKVNILPSFGIHFTPLFASKLLTTTSEVKCEKCEQWNNTEKHEKESKKRMSGSVALQKNKQSESHRHAYQIAAIDPEN